MLKNVPSEFGDISSILLVGKVRAREPSYPTHPTHPTHLPGGIRHAPFGLFGPQLVHGHPPLLPFLSQDNPGQNHRLMWEAGCNYPKYSGGNLLPFQVHSSRKVEFKVELGLKPRLWDMDVES